MRMSIQLAPESKYGMPVLIMNTWNDAVRSAAGEHVVKSVVLRGAKQIISEFPQAHVQVAEGGILVLYIMHCRGGRIGIGSGTLEYQLLASAYGVDQTCD